MTRRIKPILPAVLLPLSLLPTDGLQINCSAGGRTDGSTTLSA
ncbi:hypothetical protein [Niveispirillum sp. SYP-B3756]|nr:hypothetical protein [Niveispirillum sp. SYP-B3756]